MNPKIRKGDMLNILSSTEKYLSEWLLHPDKWASLLIDHEEPILERLWRRITFNRHPYRLCLHRLRAAHQQAESFYHNHPWPLAVKVIAGSYEMIYGFGEKPSQTTKIILKAGDAYEMIDPQMGHAIKPLVDNSLTLMLIGSSWSKSRESLTTTFKPLAPSKKDKILKLFQNFYSFKQPEASPI